MQTTTGYWDEEPCLADGWGDFFSAMVTQFNASIMGLNVSNAGMEVDKSIPTNDWDHWPNDRFVNGTAVGYWAYKPTKFMCAALLT